MIDKDDPSMIPWYGSSMKQEIIGKIGCYEWQKTNDVPLGKPYGFILFRRIVCLLNAH
jgi:hypothetical protein